VKHWVWYHSGSLSATVLPTTLRGDREGTLIDPVEGGHPQDSVDVELFAGR